MKNLLQHRWFFPQSAALAVLWLMFSSFPATAVGIPEIRNFNTPCFKDLSERNQNDKMGMPDSAIQQACQAAGDNADVAWTNLMILWKPTKDTSPVVGYRSSGVPFDAVNLLGALFGILLSYSVLGSPILGLAKLFTGSNQGVSKLLPEIVGAIILRLVFGMSLFALMGLPYAPLLGLLGLTALLATMVGSKPSLTKPTEVLAPETLFVQPSSKLTADLINDIWASLPGLLAIAIIARHDTRLMLFGVMAALFVSIGPIISFRRRLRQPWFLMAGLGTALTVITSVLTITDANNSTLLAGSNILVAIFTLGVGGIIILIFWRNNTTSVKN